MSKMITRLYANLFGGRLIWLEDNKGEIYLTIAKPDPFGGMSAPVYWLTGVGRTRLEEDGTVKESYIERWIDA